MSASKEFKKLKIEYNRLLEENQRLKDELKKSKEISLHNKTFLFDIIMENLPARIYFKDINSRFVKVNKLLAEKHGVDNPNKLIGKNDFDFFEKHLASLYFQAEQKLMANQTSMIDVEEKEVWSDGNITWASTTKVPILNDKNEVIGIFGITKDITKQKLAEQTLLESEAKLKELNANKDLFFSIIAHDLKSPFNSMLGFSKLLTENWEEINNTDKQNYMQILHSGIINTFQLLENLLMWAQNQRGKISFKPDTLNLSEVIEEIINLIKGIAANRNILLINNVANNIYLYADKNMLSLIIRNLINNSLKFTPKNGKIKISADKINGHTEISVEDTGIGIAPNVLNRIFSFHDYTSTGLNKEKGTGLGLLLCKDFVEIHGGTITAESEKSKGSIFRFTIPNKK